MQVQGEVALDEWGAGGVHADVLEGLVEVHPASRVGEDGDGPPTSVHQVGSGVRLLQFSGDVLVDICEDALGAHHHHFADDAFVLSGVQQVPDEVPGVGVVGAIQCHILPRVVAQELVPHSPPLSVRGIFAYRAGLGHGLECGVEGDGHPCGCAAFWGIRWFGLWFLVPVLDEEAHKVVLEPRMVHPDPVVSHADEGLLGLVLGHKKERLVGVGGMASIEVEPQRVVAPFATGAGS